MINLSNNQMSNLIELKNSFILDFPITDTQITNISIKECNEPLINLEDFKIPRLQHFSLLYKDIPKTEESSKVRKGLANRLIDMLAFLPDNIGILYFEGYRSLTKQKEYFIKKYLEIRKEGLSCIESYDKTSIYVSPFINNIPPHCTGGAIDITLFKIVDFTILDLGKFGTIFGPNDQSSTLCSNLTNEQINNRLMLLNSAKKAGLVNYGYEWWHFSYGDKVHSYTKGYEYAIYDIIDSNSNQFLSKEDFINYMECNYMECNY